MATEDQSSFAEQEDKVNEPVEQVQQEDKLTTETEGKVGAVQEEDKILAEGEPSVEKIQQQEAIISAEDETKVEEDKIITEIHVEQIEQADKAQVSTEQVQHIPEGDAKTDEKVKDISEIKEINESEEKAKRMQQENEKTYPDEKIQSIVDLDKPLSIKEDASNIANSSEETSFRVATSDGVKIGDQEFQAAVFDLEGHFPFSSPDGLVTPPPTPVLAEGSHADVESSEHDTNEFSTGTQTSRGTKTSKSKKKKRAGFKIEVADPRSSADSENKVITGVRDEEREKQVAECSRYAGVEKYASIFVDNVIDQSIEKVAEVTMIRGVQLEGEEVSLASLQTFVEVFGNFTKWPRIREFSKKTGEAIIEEFIQTWEYEEDWMYCIDFLLEQSDECSEYYLYEVKWSIPSKPYPIPQATASVYFTIEVSRVKPDYCAVDVTYVFEGSRLIHAPGKIPFQEHWLFGIIDAKLEMYKQIRF